MSENKEQNITMPPMKLGSTELLRTGQNMPSADVISDLTCREMIRAATEMLKRSYAPYSKFKVGAALLTKTKKIITGCNIENAAYSPSLCAERTAFAKAISEGEKEFIAMAVVGGKDGKMEDYCPPCGVCRQVMMEFSNPEKFYIILARSEQDYWIYSLAELLPMGFGPKYV